MTDKVDIIVPAYNAEQYIAECVESILAQTYKNIGVVLVDDGSTDRTGEICDRYAAKDARVVVVHQQNGGVTSARRAGAESAAGEWLAFADADDTLPPRAIERLLAASRGAGIVKGGWRITDAGGGECEIVPDDTSISAEGFIVNTLHNKLLFLSLCGAIYKRGLIDPSVFDASPAAVVTGEDRLNIIRICLNADSIRLIPDVVYRYRRHQQSVSHRFVWTYGYIAQYDDCLMKIFREKNYMDVYHAELFKYRLYTLLPLMCSPTMKARSEYVERIGGEHRNTPRSAGQRITLFLARMPYPMRRPLYTIYSKGLAVIRRSRRKTPGA
ncbi:glycosyltransferase family 2 protein [uncultured Alistipes sp.]|jgi:glycosyl transferase cpsJ(V)|uniref:glycosyltransferase family 2 protein n=1 Tax=uncultured Alistipes sp. TaxID=538949 RepID=UPI0025FBA4C4|nr:glycosyltransferase family 2 protein [uncultured Alistipes sp.]